VKRIINNPEDLVKEMIEGVVEANKHWLEIIPGLNAMKKKKIKDKVIVMSNGGAGCEPMHIGYVGIGMGDATCIGEIYTAPSAYTIYETVKAVYKGKGAILICANFMGDYLNTDMAVELLNLEGYRVEKIVVNDDLNVEPGADPDKRGGTTGIIYVLKVLGAASEKGLELEELVKLGNKVKNSVSTISVTLYSGSFPQTGELMFEIPDDTIEFGMGFNGEPGIKSSKMLKADEMVEIMFEHLKKDLELQNGDEVCSMVNSLGATTYMEQHIVFRKLAQLLKKEGVSIYDAKINRYHTSQEAGGVSITLLKLDEELKKYYNFPAVSPAFTHLPHNKQTVFQIRDFL